MSKIIFYLDRDRRPVRQKYFKQQAELVADELQAELFPVHAGQQIMEILRGFDDEVVKHLIFACHGWSNRFLMSTAGIHAWKHTYGFIPLDRFCSLAAKKLTVLPLISLCACMCGRSPSWYLWKKFQRVVPYWGKDSFAMGGERSIAALMRDRLVDLGLRPRITAHTAPGDLLRLPLGRTFYPHKRMPGVPWIEDFWGITNPDLKTRKLWIKEIRGEKAKDILLFNSSGIEIPSRNGPDEEFLKTLHA